MELKKSYKGLVLIMVLFVAAMLSISLIPASSDDLPLRLILNLMNFTMALLTGVICRNQAIYWYTGITYEQAAAAGPERRLAYARKHFQRFALTAFAGLGVTLLFSGLGLSAWFDFALLLLGLMATAISTVRIRL